MGYAFGWDESVSDAVRRVAHEQAEGAIARLDAIGDDEVDVPDAIHEARKCCKRIRGLVRLVRTAMGDDYGRVNAVARDAARVLSDVRDAHALVETFDALLAVRPDRASEDGIHSVRAALVEDAERATLAVVRDPTAVDAARDLLATLQAGIDDWALEGDLDAAIADGATRTANRAGARFDEVTHAAGPPDDELLHEWRKRVKYTWYHASLLEPASPRLLGAQADMLHAVSGALGDDHDLAVLADGLRDDSTYVGVGSLEATMSLVEEARADLQRRAVAAGARIHAEPARAWGGRLVALARTSRVHGPEPAIGGLRDVHDTVDGSASQTTSEPVGAHSTSG